MLLNIAYNKEAKTFINQYKISFFLKRYLTIKIFKKTKTNIRCPLRMGTSKNLQYIIWKHAGLTDNQNLS